MKTCLVLLAVALTAFAAPPTTTELSGQYIEARTCDVWTGACFANAEVNFAGKNAVLAWKIDQGQVGGVRLDGLSVIAVIEATDTLGQAQTGPAKAVLVVDQKASAAQREALIAAAQRLGGLLTKNIIAVESAPIRMVVNNCKEGGCASLDAGIAKVETRCLDVHHDSICGHEDDYYPPLTPDADVRSAMVVRNAYAGKGLSQTWLDANRRGAYIGSFRVGR